MRSQLQEKQIVFSLGSFWVSIVTKISHLPLNYFDIDKFARIFDPHHQVRPGIQCKADQVKLGQPRMQYENQDPFLFNHGNTGFCLPS